MEISTTASSRTRPSVARITARLDRPYPWRRTELTAAAVMVLVLVLAGWALYVQHQSADLAFHRYALTTENVDLAALLLHPDGYSGERIHVQGIAGESVVTDNGVQFTLSVPGSSDSGTAAGTSLLVLATGVVPMHQPVDVWGEARGTVPVTGSGAGDHMPAVTARYVRAAP